MRGKVVGFIRDEEFEACIKQYERLVFSICLSFIKNYFDAEDLAQDTFLAAYKNLQHFDGNNLKAYLTTIAANKCKDYLRKSERNNLPLPEDAGEILRDPAGTPEEKAIESDMQSRVYKACQSLEEPYREVATGYFCRDEKLSEMAGQTGENLKTLQTRLYRAKLKLKTIWKETSHEP